MRDPEISMKGWYGPAKCGDRGGTGSLVKVASKNVTKDGSFQMNHELLNPCAWTAKHSVDLRPDK